MHFAEECINVECIIMKPMKKAPRITLLITVGLLWLPAETIAATCDVAIDLNVEAKMRDGVVLRAEIYHPREPGKHPVIVTRTPYNRAVLQALGCRTAAHGYVAVIQDVRGRYGSDGAWYPGRNDAQDGYDTVEWAAGLPDSNGQVVMSGGSYLGIVQMFAAVMQPPHLVGIIPVATPTELRTGSVYSRGGAFQQLAAETWSSLAAIDSANRRYLLNWAVFNPAKQAADLPMSSFAALRGGGTGTEEVARYFLDWLQHPSNDDFWKSWNFEEQAARIQVPAYHVGGWYDLFTNGTLENYRILKTRAGNERARRNQRLLMGPWRHGGLDRKVGEIDFGASAAVDEADLALRWYDYLLKGATNGLEREKPVKIFVMGKNVWREEEDWPLARARPTRYFLHSGGKANSLNGDGMLSEEAPQAEASDRYTYDPANPAPTRGGGVCCSAVFPGGPFDQRTIEARDDVLVFSSAPFLADVEVTGPLSIELYASSSAVDTDFTAKLVDVWPNGYAQNIADGIQRMRYRESAETPQPMAPGEVYKVTIDLAATSNVFLAGHRLRVEISSSNFPRFDRNLNTGEDQGSSTRMLKAANTIYHDREHASVLMLPVVPQ
jgi:uncharacterized protein